MSIKLIVLPARFGVRQISVTSRSENTALPAPIMLILGATQTLRWFMYPVRSTSPPPSLHTRRGGRSSPSPFTGRDLGRGKGAGLYFTFRPGSPPDRAG